MPNNVLKKINPEEHASHKVRAIHNYDSLYFMDRNGSIMSVRPDYESPKPDTDNKVTLYDTKGRPMKFDIYRLVAKTWHERYATYLNVRSAVKGSTREDVIFQDGVLAKHKRYFGTEGKPTRLQQYV